MKRKIQSVLQLARYQVGDSAFWVSLRPQNANPEIPEESHWMLDCHPKTLYEQGPLKKFWPRNMKLPKLHHQDFDQIMNLLRSDLIVEEFLVADLIRSRSTGEFIYSNPDCEWMPETLLFDTIVAARRERSRIAKMLKRWTSESVK
jgi:hypothetical protein